MSPRSPFRLWIAIASVALLVVVALTGAAAARPICAAAPADMVGASVACCAKVAMGDSEANAGMASCALQCSASGCAAVIAARHADLQPARAVPAAAPVAVYAGWLSDPAPPPPRSLILA